MPDLSLDPKTTALILIDLQKGIAGRTTAPHTSSAVIANAVLIADRCRAAGTTVILVRVAFAADGNDRLRTPTDETFPAGSPAADWSEIVPELGPKAGDLIVTKRQWGAFYGTDLELHLRRRAIKTIVIGGISTNFGVESTARDGWERNFAMVFVEDAMAAMSGEAHAFAITNIFPRLGLVRSTSDVLKALG
jgi:nicotinamidase-related amidase